jgi:hypothetical protein
MLRPWSVVKLKLGALSPALTTGASSVPATTQISVTDSAATAPIKIRSTSLFTLLF